MRFKLLHIAETDSTNRWLKEHASAEDVVVWADFQTAGRGCGTNTWESERGKNLLFSVLFHPQAIAPNKQFLISMAVSVAIARVVEQDMLMLASTPTVSIKWPNDIYVDDRKICGILIENRLQGNCVKDSIIGVGLNVNQTVFRGDAPNPISYAQLFGNDYNRMVILQNVLGQFGRLMEQTDAEDLKAEYRRRLYRQQGYYLFRDGSGDFEAQVLTVEDDGRLVLRLQNGEKRRYAFKEVQFII